MIEAIRLTGQVSPRHKVGFYLDYQQVLQRLCLRQGAEQCRDRGDDWVALGSVGAGFFGALAPEAGNVWDDREKITQGSWTSPFTNKLLFEAGVSQFASRFGGQIPGGALTNFIPVQEQVSTRRPARRSATSRIAAGRRRARTSRRTTSGARRRATSPDRTA